MLNVDDELNLIEGEEGMKNLAKMHHDYFDTMKNLCDDDYQALLLTQSMISGLLSQGGE
jgi:hypothetical protein